MAVVIFHHGQHIMYIFNSYDRMLCFNVVWNPLPAFLAVYLESAHKVVPFSKF